MRSRHSSAEARLGLPAYRGHTLAEKIAFALLVLFILAALAGAFGEGPLSAADATSADGRLRIDYQRFCRRDAAQSLTITLSTSAGSEQVELWIDGEYLRRVQLTEIIPAPVRSTYHDVGKLRFATDGSGKPLTVRMHLEAQHAGWQRARVVAAAPGQRSEVHIEQLVYP